MVIPAPAHRGDSSTEWSIARLPRIPRCHKHRPVLTLRQLLPILGMLLGSLVLSVPAAASGVHEIAHVDSPVMAGEHHHHGSSGNVAPHDHEEEQETGDEQSDQGYGHSHLWGSSGDVATTSAASVFKASFAKQPVQDHATAQLIAVHPPPQDRPPITA